MQVCWLLLFFPLYFIGIFPLLPSWSCSFLATRVPVDQTRCSRQHTSPLSASWNIHGQPGTAAQHSTVPHRPETTYLLISSPCCLAVWCKTTVQHTRESSHLSVSLRLTQHILYFCFPLARFPWMHKHPKLRICKYFKRSFPGLIPLPVPFCSLPLNFSLSFVCMRHPSLLLGRWVGCE